MMSALMLFFSLLSLPSHADSSGTCPRAEIPRCENQAKAGPPPGTITDLSPLRQSIVAAATGEIGAVSALQGTDCKKRGWQHLAAYYALARSKALSSHELAVIKRPMLAKDDEVKINDWCGIFALWAVKAGARAEMSGQPTTCTSSSPTPDAGRKDFRGYLEYVHWKNSSRYNGASGLPLHFGTKGVQPGDIVVFKGDMNHHAVVERVIDDRIYTVDGNMDCQMVVRKSRNMDEVFSYYQVE